MIARDEELSALFADELRRHADTLGREDATPVEILRALHAVRGSAGMMGETALAESVGRLEQRARAGDEEVARVARALLEGVIMALRAGEALPLTRWPVPPPDLAPTPPPEELRALYTAEMRDRLGHIDEALADASAGPDHALSDIRRHVHAVKGAASAVGDNVAVWFVHGFESHLRDEAARGPSALLEEARSMRPILAAIIADPARALATLRGAPTAVDLPGSSAPPESTRYRSGSPSEGARAPHDSSAPARRFDDDLDDGSLRVPTLALDRVVERAGALSALVAKLSPEEGAPLRGALELRAASTLIASALRLIGPPRPWGTPAAAIEQLRRAGETLAALSRSRENEGVRSRALEERLAAHASQVAGDVRALRRTELSWLFSRVKSSITAQASRLGRSLRIVTSGDDLPVDRRVLEQLLDPLLQLAGNALVHGMESPAARIAARKTEALCLRLDAQLRQGLLRVTVSDDGRGVDVERVRERVLSLGLLDEKAAAAASTSALLDLLLLPGVSTRREISELAGRGIGLDMATTALLRLGASLRLASESGRGVTATLDVPLESGLVPVLWVEAGEHRYGLPIADVVQVVVGEAPRAVRLERLVERPGSPALLPRRRGRATDPAEDEGTLTVLVEPLGHPPFSLVVDRAGGIEDVAVRRLPGLVVAAGPYLGAVTREDGGLDLLLDADALAELSA